MKKESKYNRNYTSFISYCNAVQLLKFSFISTNFLTASVIIVFSPNWLVVSCEFTKLAANWEFIFLWISSSSTLSSCESFSLLSLIYKTKREENTKNLCIVFPFGDGNILMSFSCVILYKKFATSFVMIFPFFSFRHRIKKKTFSVEMIIYFI